ncbi:hypothetical protein MPTK1_4g07190 [Marchantia polymorpha subsp. ruderalis]
MLLYPRWRRSLFLNLLPRIKLDSKSSTFRIRTDLQAQAGQDTSGKQGGLAATRNDERILPVASQLNLWTYLRQ